MFQAIFGISVMAIGSAAASVAIFAMDKLPVSETNIHSLSYAAANLGAFAVAGLLIMFAGALVAITARV